MTALARVAGALACPHCRQSPTVRDRTLRCPAGHAYDIARQGHVNLLGRAAPAGADTTTMVQARQRFLASGSYRPIVDALRRWLPTDGLLLDAGTGTGWYAAELLDAAPRLLALGLDVSPDAARLAARTHSRLAVAVADVWQRLPLQDAVASAVTCVFAPRNPAEYARVLVPGGLLLVVTPEPDHLDRARQQFGLLGIEPDKGRRLRAGLADHVEVVAEEDVHAELDLTAEQAADLVAMGPSAHHGAAAAAPVRTALSVRLTVARSAPA